MFVLDSMYDSKTQTLNFGELQAAWLYQSLLEMTNKHGWTVVIFTHYFDFAQTSNVNYVVKAFGNKGTSYAGYIFDASMDTKFVGVIHGHRHQDMDNIDPETGKPSFNVNVIGIRAAFGVEPNISILTINQDSKHLYETEINGTDREYEF